MKQNIPVWTYAIIVLLFLLLIAVVIGTVIPQLERSAQAQSETANAQAGIDRQATHEAHLGETATAAPPSSFGIRRTNSAMTQTAVLSASATFTPTPTAPYPPMLGLQRPADSLRCRRDTLCPTHQRITLQEARHRCERQVQACDYRRELGKTWIEQIRMQAENSGGYKPDHSVNKHSRSSYSRIPKSSAGATGRGVRRFVG